MNIKVRQKIMYIARMRLRTQLNDVRIAEILGITQSGLSRIIALPEYKEIEEEILQTNVTKLDEALADNTEAMRKHFAPAIPAAMQALVEAVTQRRDLRVMTSAAKEILDRDPNGTFITASKSANAGGQFVGPVPLSMLANAVTQGNKAASAVRGDPPLVVSEPAKGVN